MNPTLSAALSLLPTHIEWHPGYDERTEVYASITIDAIHLRLDIGYYPERQAYRLAANISGHDRPHVRVSLGDRADLRSAWTEVAEVVSRVDAAAGAAMGQPRETKADAQPKPYRTGDVVRHIPSGEEWLEEWLVADVTNTHIGCAGWPHTLAPFADVELVEAATDVYHLELLQRMADMSSPDPRRSYAIDMLAKMDAQEKT